MNPKDALILAQVAAKAAATVHAGTGDMTTYPQTVETIHADLLARASRGVTTLQAETMETAVANVAAVFAPPDPVLPPPAQFPAPAPAPVAPAQSTGNDKEDAMWADLVAHPDNWWNNIQEGGTSYTGGAKPDFRHKTAVDSKGNKVALWLVSRRYGRVAPDYVFSAFGYEKPGAVQQVPAANATAPATPDPFDKPF